MGSKLTVKNNSGYYNHTRNEENGLKSRIMNRHAKWKKHMNRLTRGKSKSSMKRKTRKNKN